LPLENKDDESAIGISICLKNYELVYENKYFNAAMYKILDVLLGEKSAALDLVYVSFGQLSDDPETDGLIELGELPDYILWKKSQVK